MRRPVIESLLKGKSMGALSAFLCSLRHLPGEAIRLAEQRLPAAVEELRGMNAERIVSLLVRCIKEHTGASAVVAGIIIIISGCMIVPARGRLIPMDQEMRTALELLRSTPTGRVIISKAGKSTRGLPIFLTLGTTEKNDLFDERGEAVVGDTRAYFKNIANCCLPNGVFIYSNKDVTCSRPHLIALNLAFELENVIYAMKNPGAESAEDSPAAWQTLEKVAGELRLTE